MRTKRELFEDAAADANLIASLRFGLEDTMQLMQVANLSTNRFRAVKSLFKDLGKPIILASEPTVRDFREKLAVRTEFHEVMLAGGSKKEPCEVKSLVMTASITDSLQRDLDYILSIDEFVPRPYLDNGKNRLFRSEMAVDGMANTR